MDHSIICSKKEFLNIQYDKVDYPTLDINDSLNIRENNSNDNILTDINNKEFFNNFFDSFNLGDQEEKNMSNIKQQKELFLETNTISKEISKMNEDELKRQLKLKRNREAAKEVRLRKKEFFENLMIEYNILKNENQNLLNIINKCSICKEKFMSMSSDERRKNNDKIYDSLNKILSEGNKRNSNKKKFLFITAITIISIINIFNVPLNIMNCFKYFENNKIDYLRNLNDDYYKNYSIDESQNLLLNKLDSSNNNEALYIHFAEYYYLIKNARKSLNETYDLKNELNKNIKIFQEKDINKEELTKENAKRCVKCVVEVDKKSIKMKGDEFTFYLSDRGLSKYFKNNKDGVFPKFNFDENAKKSKGFSKIFAIKCKILAYCINDLYSEKIGN